MFWCVVWAKSYEVSNGFGFGMPYSFREPFDVTPICLKVMFLKCLKSCSSLLKSLPYWLLFSKEWIFTTYFVAAGYSIPTSRRFVTVYFAILFLNKLVALVHWWGSPKMGIQNETVSLRCHFLFNYHFKLSETDHRDLDCFFLWTTWQPGGG